MGWVGQYSSVLSLAHVQQTWHASRAPASPLAQAFSVEWGRAASGEVPREVCVGLLGFAMQVVPDLFVVAVVLHFRIVEAFGERGTPLA